MWTEISSNSYFFTRREKYAEYVATISREDLILFYSTFLLPASTRRRKFASQFFGAGKRYPLKVMSCGNAGTDSVGISQKKQVLITDPSAFKRALALRSVPCYDAILPVVEVPASVE